MASTDMKQSDDAYEQQNDPAPGNAPEDLARDNEYASRTGQSTIPVQKDEMPVGDTAASYSGADPNSDKALGELAPPPPDHVLQGNSD